MDAPVIDTPVVTPAVPAPEIKVEPEAKVETPEVKPAETPPEPKKEEPVSPKLAALQRQERKLAQEHARLKADRDALAKDKADLENLKTVRETFRRDPSKALEVLGVSYEDLTKAFISYQSNPEMAAIKAEVESLKSQTERQKAEAFKAEQAQRDAMVTNWRAEQAKTFTAMADKFELVSAFSTPDTVVALIEKNYEQTAADDPEGKGVLWTVEEAAAKLEEHYAERQRGIMAKSASKYLPKPKEEPKPEVKKDEPKTLSANMAAGSSSKPVAVSPEEARQRAIKRLQEMGW